MGDVIGAVNNQRIESVVDFIKVMNTAPVNQDIALGIYRDGRRIGITMKG
jgi:S1-C subfamily serine protease